MEKYDFNSPNGKNKPFNFKWFGLFGAIFWAFFLAMALSNVISPYLSQILNGLLTGVTSLLIGMSIAFISYRMVDFIERIIMKNAFTQSPYKFAIKRTISITCVVLVIVGVFAVIIAILVPKVIEIVQRITAGSGDGGTQIYNNVVNEICNLFQQWFGAEVSQETIKGILNSVFEWFISTVGYLNNLLALSFSVLSGFFNTLIGIIIAILFLKDKEKISKFSRRFTYANFKKERADELCVMANNANKILYSYIICKVIEFAIVFVSLGLTYSIMGLEFTWELALIIGLFNFIPYFGIYIGTVPAVLITLIFNSINSALYMAIATIIITTIEFNTLIPFITGKRLKVSALLVVVSIIIGGAMFGILGMLFAPPIAALISVIVTGNIELKENHMKYVMELDKAREKNLQDEKEQLGIVSGIVETKKEDEFLSESKKNIKEDKPKIGNEPSQKEKLEAEKSDEKNVKETVEEKVKIDKLDKEDKLEDVTDNNVDTKLDEKKKVAKKSNTSDVKKIRTKSKKIVKAKTSAKKTTKIKKNS